MATSNLTFKQFKEMINNVQGKIVVTSWDQQSTIKYLYEDGWKDNTPEAYGFCGEELDAQRVIECKPFNSKDEVLEYIKDMKFFIDTDDETLYLTAEEIKNLDPETTGVGEYALILDHVPTLEQIQERYGHQLQDDEDASDLWDTVLELIEEGSSPDDSILIRE